MLTALGRRSEVADAAELRRAVIERQKMDPPLLPGGTAIPHARTDSVRTVVMAIATSPSPIMFGEIPVRLMFLIGVPNAAVGEYLQITSFLARNLRGGHLLDRLMNAENIQQFVAAFAGLAPAIDSEALARRALPPERTASNTDLGDIYRFLRGNAFRRIPQSKRAAPLSRDRL